MRSAFVLSAAVLALGAASISVLAAPADEPGHVAQPSGLYQGALHGYTPNSVTGGTVIDTPQLVKLIADAHPLLLDVAEEDRKPSFVGKDTPWFPIHRSIPGAVFLQGGGSGSEDPGYVEAFMRTVATLAGSNKAKPIVTFCHPDCWGSYNAAKRLAELGYTHVYWYRDGVEGWQADHDTQVVKPNAAWVAALAKMTKGTNATQ